MTNPKTPGGSSGLPMGKESLCRRSQEMITAKLSDADGTIISKGDAVLFPDEREALFYPRDGAPSGIVRSRVETLILANTNAPLSISEIQDCQEKTSQEPHFHMVLK
jgi:hypothetical protein